MPKGVDVMCVHLPHSSRRSLDGSTASARRAGMADAATPSSAIGSTATPATDDMTSARKLQVNAKVQVQEIVRDLWLQHSHSYPHCMPVSQFH